VILSLGLTIWVESIVVAGFGLWQRKPLRHLLLSSILANLLTQILLWTVLNMFPNDYQATLFISEIILWGVEGMILFFYRPNQLKLAQALLLSLTINLASFTLGWFLPI
jgi:hypothetical protein